MTNNEIKQSQVCNMPSDTQSTEERVQAEFLWAANRWQHTMTPEDLVHALCECPAFLDLVRDAKGALPTEPTDAMINAGLQSTNGRLNIPGSGLTVAREKMRIRYKAMIMEWQKDSAIDMQTTDTDTPTTVVIGNLATVVSGDRTGAIVYVQRQNEDGQYHCDLGEDQGYVDLDGRLLRSWKSVQSIDNRAIVCHHLIGTS